MILTVTPNLALDVTYEVSALIPRAEHRVQRVHSRAGGKGVNVARVLSESGYKVTVAGFAGGQVGEWVRAELTASGIREGLTGIEQETRRTLAVVSQTVGEATLFNEPGPDVIRAEWDELQRHFIELLAHARVVVLSGSLPPGIPPDAYATLCRRAATGNVPVVVDAGGDVLRRAAAAAPTVVAPNASELVDATGADDPENGCVDLLRAGARSVVASLGSDGLLVTTPAGTWRASLAEQVHGNPTGAGDAVTAALAAGCVEGHDWPQTLREAVALSAAAVHAPMAGSFDDAARCRYLPAVHVEEIHGSHADW